MVSDIYPSFIVATVASSPFSFGDTIRILSYKVQLPIISNSDRQSPGFRTLFILWERTGTVERNGLQILPETRQMYIFVPIEVSRGWVISLTLMASILALVPLRPTLANLRLSKRAIYDRDCPSSLKAASKDSFIRRKLDIMNLKLLIYDSVSIH